MSDTTHGATAAPQMLGRYELGQIEGAELITDPAKFPKSFTEAPELAALVRQGKLPPVAERIGQDPLVLKPVHGIGKHGGTLRRGFMSASRSGPGDHVSDDLLLQITPRSHGVALPLATATATRLRSHIHAFTHSG